MSCLRLSFKFPPARKAWKILATKLQKKLPKFHRPSKKLEYGRSPLKAHQYPRRALSRKSCLPEKQLIVKPYPHQPRRYAFKKKSKPVFVDKLFKETSTYGTALSVSELVDHKKSRGKFINKSSVGAGSTSDFTEGDVASGPECARRNHNVIDGGHAGGRGLDDHDGMWESVGLASPLMRNIDERAEAFITKFRADMKLQEAMQAGRQS